MRLRLLGATSLKDESGADLLKNPQPKRLALLAYLAVAARGDIIRRDLLLAMFWRDATERDARRSLNQAVHYLRQLVGADVIVGGADTLGVDPSKLSCDATHFDDAIRDLNYDVAMKLYRGHMMDGFFISGAPDFEEWLARQRDLRAHRAADAAWWLADQATSPSEAVELGARAYALAPDESGTRRWMSLYDRLGDRARAMAVYDAFARKLSAEYGTSPAPETQRLIAQIRACATESPATVVSPAYAPNSTPVAAYVPPARPSHATRVAVGAVVVAVVVALLVAGGAALARLRTRAPDTNVVAVMPFAYHGAANRAYIGEGVASLLASSMNGVGRIRTVDPRSLFGAVSRGDATVARTTHGARAIASQLGAGTIVVGDITEAEGRVRMSATYSLGGDAPDTRVQAEGASERLFEVVDELASKLIARRTSGDVASRSASRTTSSIDAWRFFVAGDAEYRAGDYGAAVASLRDAVRIDSTFALAHFRLATASNWTGDDGLTTQATTAAVRHRGRLTPLDRAKLEAWRHGRTGHPDSAEAAYTRIVEENPTDVESLYHLADLRFHNNAAFGRPLASMWPEWRRIVTLDPGHAGALMHAARIAAAMRSPERFDSIAAHMQALEVDADRAAEMRVLRAFAFQDRPARVAAARDYERMEPVTRRGVFESGAAVTPAIRDVAELLMPSMLHPHYFERREAGLMLQRAQLELAQGRLASAEATIDSTERLDPAHTREFRALFAVLPIPTSSRESRRVIEQQLASIARPTHARGALLWYYLRAQLALRDGDTASAERLTAMVDTVSGPGDDPRAHRYVGRILRAELLRGRGKADQALRELGPIRYFTDGGVWAYYLAHWRFLRAELLAETGQVDEALRWYATFPDFRVYDFMYLNAALMRSAELLEARGDRARAAEKYEELLALWEHSQGMDAYVRDVKARLARLR